MSKRRKPDPSLIWAYCRVSTLKGEQELSLDEQVRWAQAFARQRGAHIEVFRERASAKTLIGRPVCSRMLDQIEHGSEVPPSMLIATSFDRLSRDMTDTLILARCIRSAGITLYIRDRGEVPMDSFADQAALVGQAMGGHAENEARSNRCKASWQRRRSEGKPMTNKSPYGLQLLSERDRAEPVTASWVLRAFQWYAKGVGTPTIARRFQENAPAHRVRSTRVGSDGEPIIRERVHVFDDNKIRKMLRQSRYRGTVVPEELFDRVQEALASKPKWRNTRTHEYPFSGAIRCAGCGRCFHGHATGGTRKKRVADGTLRAYPNARRTRYYGCTLCGYMLNAESLESTLLDATGKITASKRTIQAWIDSADQFKEQPSPAERKRLVHLLESNAFERRRQRVWQLAVENNISGSDLSKQLTAIASEESAARDRLAKLDSAAQRKVEVQRTESRAKQLLANFSALFGAAPYEQKRELANAVVKCLGGAVAAKSGLQLLRQPETIVPWIRIDHRITNGHTIRKSIT